MGGGAAGCPSGTSTLTCRRCMISSRCSWVSAVMRSVGFHGRNTGSSGPPLLLVRAGLLLVLVALPLKARLPPSARACPRSAAHPPPPPPPPPKELVVEVE